MKMVRFLQLEEKKFLCVGLDSEFRQISQEIRKRHESVREAIVAFNTGIIWQTRDYVCAYMADQNFYLEMGVEGMMALRDTIKVVHTIAPKAPFILGCYGGGVSHSNVALARYAFDCLDADAVTLNPWFGEEAMKPLLNRREKGVIVTCRTSNYGAKEFQDLKLADHEDVPLFKTVAHRVSTYWNGNHNCALLMGPMGYGEIAKVREVADRLPLFVTGIGTQSKSQQIDEEDVQEIICNGINSDGFGIAICAARSVIFSANPHDEVVRLTNLINKCREKKVA